MEQTVSMRNIIFQILFRWRPIVIFSLLLALLCGGYRAHQQVQAETDPEVSMALRKAYEDEVFAYESDKTRLEASLVRLESEYESMLSYMENSLLLTFDPYDVYRGKVEVYLDSYYEIMPSMTYQTPDTIGQLMAAYQNKMSDGDLYATIGEEINPQLALKFISELVSISYNQGNRTIVFNIQMPDREGVELVGDIIVSYIDALSETLQREVADHGITVTKSEINTWIDEDLKTKQTSLHYQINTFPLSILEKERELMELEEPSEFSLSIKTVIKYFITGGVVGGILSVGLFFVIALLSNKLQDEITVERDLDQIVLGIKPIARKNGNSIDRMIDKTYNRSLINTEEDFIMYVVETVESLHTNQTIHFTGSIAPEVITEIYKKINEKFTVTTSVGGFILQDKSSYHQLEQAQAVVLIEQRNKTNINDLERELNYLKKMDKKVLGIILL